MTISSAVQTIIWTVLFVVPGYFAVMVKHYWLSTLGRPGERVLESIGWSIAIYLGLSFLPNSIFNLPDFQLEISKNMTTPEKALFSSEFLIAYGFTLAFGILVALVYSMIFSLRLWPALFGRSPHARVWDEFWAANKKRAAKAGVWIEAKDNTVWAGYLKRASDTPGERELWLTGVKQYKCEELFETATTDLLINTSDISRIFILEDNLHQNQGSNPVAAETSDEIAKSTGGGANERDSA